jgi:hypothetical protein
MGRAKPHEIRAERKVISPRDLSRYSPHVILLPIYDDGWRPAFRQGEIAVVDTSNCMPEDGAAVCIRGGQNRFAIVELCQWDEKRTKTVQPAKDTEQPYWSMLYEKRRLAKPTPEDLEWAPDGFIRWGDGPVDTRIMKSMLVGRVAGVLGSTETARWAI